MEHFSDQHFLLLIALVAMVFYILGRRSKDGGASGRDFTRRREETDIEQVLASVPATTLEEVDRLMADRRKIDAIKVLRAATGLGLRDAKCAVERRAGR